MKSFTRFFLLLFVALSLFSSASCSKKEKMLLSEKKMENVLFDYHVAEGIARMKSADSTQQRVLFNAVLEKHNISQAQFDSSMIFYMKHADRLHGIYEHLSERLTNEGRLQGLEGNNLSMAFTLEGDTANLWNLETEKVLTPYNPDNLLKFNIVADTSFLAGDKLIMSFRTDFFYQDGTRNAYAAFSVRFLNDSVVTRTKQLTSQGLTTFEVNDDKRLGVKEILGYIMQRPPTSKSERHSSSLRLMIVSDIKLIRMHTEEPENFSKEIEEEAKDSIESMPDTIKTSQNTNLNNDNNEKIKPVSATISDKPNN